MIYFDYFKVNLSSFPSETLNEICVARIKVVESLHCSEASMATYRLQ
jgi:hypothetical protein